MNNKANLQNKDIWPLINDQTGLETREKT
jgi:hypothetical protein